MSIEIHTLDAERFGTARWYVVSSVGAFAIE
jgi:hypothetical protein